uniref:rRNA biogenesis protein RRP36 n=1 Tax=Elaeophora elaphi TaxID=1147741 RepID=A0A0R3S486_9BILA
MEEEMKILRMRRTFPKKTTVNNNSKPKMERWKRDHRKYVQSTFSEKDNSDDCNNNEVGVKLKLQNKNKKTKKAKKKTISVKKNATKQSKESLRAKECDFDTNASTENDRSVTWISNDDQTSDRRRLFAANRSNSPKKRLPSTSDEEKNNSLNNIRKSGIKTKSDKSAFTNNVAQDTDKHSFDEKKVELAEPRKSTREVMTSPVHEHEAVDLDNTGFREELAKIPLGKAKQLQERLGKKLFDKAFFAEDSSPKLNKKSAQRTFVRENPKRPREVSSKIPVSKFRNVFENEKIERPIFDPRFDDRCGEFNSYIYHNNYGFLDEIRQREKKILIKELKNATEEGNVNRNRLKEALKKMENQEKTQADVNRRKEIIREIRHENNERMRQGLPPIFKTRAQIRELIWRKKYDELKGGKKLEKYLRRKTKKKDKRYGISGSVSHQNENEAVSFFGD